MKKKECMMRLTAIALSAMMLVGCGSQTTQTEAPKETKAVETTAAETGAEETEATETEAKETQAKADLSDAPEIEGLICTGKTQLKYAEGFNIYQYEGGYSLICINDEGDFLIVPEDGETPEKLNEGTTVLQKPLDNIYLAATSAMSLFDAMDGIGNVRFSSLQESGWYVDAAIEAMKSGDMVYAGKYSEPDYEMLVDEGCDLAIESTMIYHSPKVKEMIEMLDIPVLIDRSSYEPHPLGRTEWIKLYSALVGTEKKAEEFFDKQSASVEALDVNEKSDKSVAYFYISTQGSVVVRNPKDYITKMIEMGGAVNPYSELESESATVEMTMEEFYNLTKDADYLIYNASIDASVKSMKDLIGKSELFNDFKAVKENHVWTTGKSLYQATDIVSNLILDVNNMLTDTDESKMSFLSLLQ